MHHALHTADWVMIVGYFIIMIIIGLYFMNRMGDIHEFFGGKGQVPWWLSGVSFYMSAVSAMSFVMYSAMAYRYGLVAVVVCWIAVPGVIAAVVFFSSRWRRAASTSALEFIETRFDHRVRHWLVWTTIPLRTIDDGMKIYAIGVLVSAGLGFPLTYAIFFSGVITLAYTFLGGLWAVMVTDFVQAILKIMAIAVLVPLALKAVGGIDGLIRQLPPEAFHLTTPKLDAFYMVCFFLIIVLNYSSSWALVQRYFTVPSDADAKKVGYLVAALNFVVPPFMILPALAARIFLPGITDFNSIYALVCRELLPMGMVGLLVAALFASTMSMLSGDYNTMAGVLTNDVYRILFPKSDSRRLMRVARITTLLIGLLTLGLAFVVMHSSASKGLFEFMVGLFSVFIAPIALPMIAGLISTRVTAGGALLGSMCGLAAGVALFIFFQKFPDLPAAARKTELTTIATTLVTLGGIVLGSLKMRVVEAEKIAVFFRRLATDPDASQPAPKSRALAAILPAIGYSVGAMGLLLLVSLLFSEHQPGWTYSVIVSVIMTLLGILFVLPGLRARNKPALPAPGQASTPIHPQPRASE